MDAAGGMVGKPQDKNKSLVFENRALKISMKKYLVIALLLFSLRSFAQRIEVTEDDYNNTQVEMADKMRENGKIYVVVLVISLVMGGILTYVITIDRKLRRLEKEID